VKPDPDRAREVLEAALKSCWEPGTTKTDLFVALGEALGFLRGYLLPKEVLDGYRCSFCGARGVKLWRTVHSAAEAWCSRCGTAQAGLADTIDAEGRIAALYSGRADGRSDQIYSPDQGQNLLPWVPAPDGGTWGYTSVPPEGCHWWRSLPTRAPG
jgi:hypothetical protein